MRNSLLVERISIVLVFLVCCVLVGAQTSAVPDSQSPPESQASSQSQTATQNTERPPQEIPPVPLYAAEPSSTGAMLGSGVLVTNPGALIEARGGGIQGGTSAAPFPMVHRYDFIYGMSSSAVYRTAMPGFPDDRANTSVLLNPYVGLLGRTRTGSYLLDYTLNAMPYDTLGSPASAFHQFTASMNGLFTRNLDWTVSGNGGFGSESARVLGPISYQVVGGLPTSDTSNAILAAPNENVLTGSLNGTLGWQKSPRDRFTFALTSSYTSYTGETGVPAEGQGHATSGGGTLTYERTLSARTRLFTFGDYFHLFGAGGCSSYGGGVGLTHEASRKLSVSVQGGPQFTTEGCGGQQGANFSGSILVRPTARTSAYLIVSRSFTTAYRLNSAWDDNISAGLSHNTRLFEFNIDTSYVRGGVQPSYQGLFVGPNVRYHMQPTLSWLLGYRWYHGSSLGNTQIGNMNFATVTLEWHPRAIGFPR